MFKGLKIEKVKKVEKIEKVENQAAIVNEIFDKIGLKIITSDSKIRYKA